MAVLKVKFWALIFIIRIRFPPGKSLVTILYIVEPELGVTILNNSVDNNE